MFCSTSYLVSFGLFAFYWIAFRLPLVVLVVPLGHVGLLPGDDILSIRLDSEHSQVAIELLNRIVENLLLLLGGLCILAFWRRRNEDLGKTFPNFGELLPILGGDYLGLARGRDAVLDF